MNSIRAKSKEFIKIIFITHLLDRQNYI
ncbi:protein of unknown function [Denitratisoma oestradiolicum]|uniref:Uncharacterized protein n=1 Tax=Denitratisoma oestradiolicum TaxID=311182 RepID=A0A6S6XZH5_9PROT|nr:protein of unknown function [Denitratisoma oestradiolicum]